MQTNRTATRLEGLDALRGIAALMVLAHHAAPETTIAGRNYLSVDFFFMLSGFVMARTYEHRFAGISPPQFLLARYLRFLPIMAAGAVFGAIAAIGHWPVPVVLGLFLLSAVVLPLFGPVLFPLNPPAWSIFAELVANFLHALVLRHLSLISLALVAGAAVLVSVWLDPQGLRTPTAIGIARVLIGYPIGIMLWRLNGETARSPWLISVILLVSAPVLAGIFELGAWADYLFVLAICPLVILAGLSAPSRAKAPLAALGAASFPLYATHNPIVFLAADWAYSPLAGVGLALAAAFVLAFLDAHGRRILLSRRKLARQIGAPTTTN